MEYNLKEHQFKPGETVSAVLKFYNGYDLSAYTIDYLLKKTFEINKKEVPKVGSILQIPVISNE